MPRFPASVRPLRGTVKAIDGLPVLDKPSISAVEGSEAIVEAFRRLTMTTIGLFKLNLPPSPDELRALQQKAVQSIKNSTANQALLEQQAGLGDRDYIPLFIAFFVDLCILLVSINRPVNRMQKLVATARDARGSYAHQVVSKFHNVHHQGGNERLSPFHDVMFDAYGSQYVAVPLSVKAEGDEEDGHKMTDAHKKKVMEAHYLATLLAALEAGGLVTQAHMVRKNLVKAKLTAIGSKFSSSSSFRVYRFQPGAWSAIVMDEILGASDELDEVKRIENHYARELERLRGPHLTLDMTPNPITDEEGLKNVDHKEEFSEQNVSQEDINHGGEQEDQAEDLLGDELSSNDEMSENDLDNEPTEMSVEGDDKDHLNGTELTDNFSEHSEKNRADKITQEKKPEEFLSSLSTHAPLNGHGAPNAESLHPEYSSQDDRLAETLEPLIDIDFEQLLTQIPEEQTSDQALAQSGLEPSTEIVTEAQANDYDDINSDEASAVIYLEARQDHVEEKVNSHTAIEPGSARVNGHKNLKTEVTALQEEESHAKEEYEKSGRKEENIEDIAKLIAPSHATPPYPQLAEKAADEELTDEVFYGAGLAPHPSDESQMTDLAAHEKRNWNGHYHVFRSAQEQSLRSTHDEPKMASNYDDFDVEKIRNWYAKREEKPNGHA